MADVIDHSGLPRLTLDVDGSVVSTGLRVEGARRGFNPHRRKVPSYYPITAYEANTGQVLRVCNRAGNVHDGQASLAFLGELFKQLRATLKRRPVLEMRMDGAFFQAAVIDVLDAEGALYAIKVPFWRWLGLKERIARPPNMGARGRHGGMFRSVALGAGLVTRDACCGVPQACASPDGEELSAGSLRP